MIGFDYTDRIDPAALKAAGCSVVFRYLSNPGWPKNLTAPEASELLAAGIPIVLNYETTATFMLGGYSAGVSCARSARAQATALGAPADARIFYSADFDASSAQVSVLLDFLRGAASVDGAARVGLYGGLRAVQAAASAGYATWQTVAWSGGQWDSRAAARQTGEQPTVGGVEVDKNVIINLAALGAWGGSTSGDDMPLTQQDADLVAAAVYRHGEEAVTLNGQQLKNVPLGNLTHGAWVAVNDPHGPVLSALSALKSSVDALVARPQLDQAALEAFIVQHQASGGTAADLAAALINQLQHIELPGTAQ